MTLIRSLILAIASASLAITVAGCSDKAGDSNLRATDSHAGAQSSSGPAQTRPTLTDPKIQPPSQHNQYTGARPDIVFDPCTWISDDTIRKSGFDPSTRKRGPDQIAERSFLTCAFTDGNPLDGLVLQVNSSNATWDEDMAKVRDYSEPLTINGREAMWVRNPGIKQDCQIDIRTKVGFVQVAVSSNSLQDTGRPCGNLENIASNIETEIGKDN
ncbi:DUF3558 domain-containing protein [Nocardia veterana]|uniref:DUF3558 domain-containing protein n=1 Tax=Nocardia veterana TaxID=132249 RepID=A0A7X6LXR6_9NOCA|nr:DUF3558 domain-containing protein [Nocardia veterana]NKY86488.1 DUF3558 domain-containing protein [Nocardia veterana]